MPEWALIFALGFAGASALHTREGWVASRAMLALMAGTALGSGLVWAGLPVPIPLALTADCVIIALIMAAPTNRREKVIIGLFFVAWPFYLFEDAVRDPATTIITSCQLLLTVPWHKVWERSLRTTARVAERDPFDLRVAEAGDAR